MNQDPKQNRPGHGNQNEPDHSKRTKSILIMVVVALAFTIIINLVYTSIAKLLSQADHLHRVSDAAGRGQGGFGGHRHRPLLDPHQGGGRKARGQADHLLHRPSHQHGSLAADGGDDRKGHQDRRAHRGGDEPAPLHPAHVDSAPWHLLPGHQPLYELHE